MERTLSIIKPDGTKRNLVGKIIGRFEEEGLRIAACEMKWLQVREAEGFYAEHRERPFFRELCDFMISGPVVVMCLTGHNAIAKNREIMGATNPAEAKEGSIRKMFAKSIGENTVHGSDSPQSASREISYFFPATQILEP
jgi:nucleoside-diphosphate kinase